MKFVHTAFTLVALVAIASAQDNFNIDWGAVDVNDVRFDSMNVYAMTSLPNGNVVTCYKHLAPGNAAGNNFFAVRAGADGAHVINETAFNPSQGSNEFVMGCASLAGNQIVATAYGNGVSYFERRDSDGTSLGVTTLSYPNHETFVTTLSNGNFIIYSWGASPDIGCWFEIYTAAGVKLGNTGRLDNNQGACTTPLVAAYDGGFVAAYQIYTNPFYVDYAVRYNNDGTPATLHTSIDSNVGTGKVYKIAVSNDNNYLFTVSDMYGAPTNIRTRTFELVTFTPTDTLVSYTAIAYVPYDVVSIRNNEFVFAYRSEPTTGNFFINLHGVSYDGTATFSGFSAPDDCGVSGVYPSYTLQMTEITATKFALGFRCENDRIKVVQLSVPAVGPNPPGPNPPGPNPPGPASPSSCNCPEALDVDYTQDRIPDALKDAYSSIRLDESNWEVVLSVHNVRHLYHGHVICNKLDTRNNAQTAFTPYVSAWDANELWNSNNCSIGALDTPAPSLDIDVVRFDNCTKTYSMTFSLVDAAKQSSRCSIITTTEDLNVGCSLTFSSVRAYDLTEPTAFLSAETSFSANLTLPRNLNKNVSDLLYATLAKCNVLNAPEFAIDCRIPGQWTFETTFGVSQNINNWIDATSCVQSQTAVATFVRCGLNSVPVGAYTEALANVSATVAGTSEVINFSLEYTLPRAASATASASLQNFIISIGMLNEKYYYAGADRATLYVHVFDTARLEITQLDMFNANGQSYALRDYNQFQLSETSNASHFIIEFRPSAIRQDSAFYRNGPHGVNISFLFTAAAGRRMSTQDVGFVTFDNIRVQGDQADASGAAAGELGASAAPAFSATVLIAAVAGVAVVAVGAIAAAVIFRRRSSSRAAAPGAEAAAKPDAAHCEVVVPEDQV